MTTIKYSANRLSVPVYFILAFVISWGAILIFAGPEGIPATPDQAVMLGMAMLLGPTSASILMIGVTSGRAGYRELLSRLLRWRVNAIWYLIALLAAPLATAVTLLAITFFSPEFVPNLFTSGEKASMIVMGIVAGLMVGLFEELGWTGFAVPKMRLRYSIVTTGLILGLLWGAWHFLLFWESDSFSGFIPFVLLLARLFSWLPAYRILMVWVYDRTESLLVVILMHMSLVATLTTIDPVLTGTNLVIFIVARAAILWAIVAAVAVLSRRRLETGEYILTR